MFSYLFRTNISQTKIMTEINNSIHLALKELSIKKKKIEVTQLIADGANLNELNEHLETPLHVAISQGMEDVAAELITKNAQTS